MTDAYCVKCKAKRQMQDGERVTMKNGRPAMKGKCPECGTVHHPAHDVAAVDVHDDVEVVIAPLLRPEQPRDIPGPHLVRRRGHQLGLLVLGMGALRPAFLNRHLGGQNTIHRAFAAQVDLFVEQRGHHLGG